MKALYSNDEEGAAKFLLERCSKPPMSWKNNSICGNL